MGAAAVTSNRLLKLDDRGGARDCLVGGIGVVIAQTFFAPNDHHRVLHHRHCIYPGDEVRIAGVKVGTIASIEPDGTQAKMTLRVDRGVPSPPTPRPSSSPRTWSPRATSSSRPPTSRGPTMADGAVIPLDRTAVPVEWDEVKSS